VRRSSTSVVANPVLIGAVTVLVVVVAVFLAYNANNGLPFVPTRQVDAYISNASNLVRGNDVREGGLRIGVVSDIKPHVLANGKAGAELVLKLDTTEGKLPVDSRVIIRQQSVLGLKYVEIDRGHARRTLPDGGALPADQAHVPVQIDQLLSTFDATTRRNSQRVLTGVGDTLAGRGADLNLTVAELPPLFKHLTPVAANLSSRRTDLAGFFRGAERTAGAVAPVARTASRVFTDLGTTFRAISADVGRLQDTIAKSPPTLEVGTRSLAVQRPFLNDLTLLSADLRPAAQELRVALPDINVALQEGTPVLRRSVTLDAKLETSLRALEALARDPGTNIAVQALTGTVTTLNPLLRYIGPFQTVCNNWNYFWTFVAEQFTESDKFGYAQRALLNTNGVQTNGIGPQPGLAVEPANGLDYNPASASLGAKEFLHAQPYGAAIDNHGNADCEIGQWGYMQGRLTTVTINGRTGSAPPGFNIVTAPRTPGDQGPTYKGRARVPRGETFQTQPNGEVIK
jgi:virulence factor Mce-like protein